MMNAATAAVESQIRLGMRAGEPGAIAAAFVNAVPNEGEAGLKIPPACTPEAARSARRPGRRC